jgi:hypothetical protein
VNSHSLAPAKAGVSDLARRLAREAEAVCRHYLPHGCRSGRYWVTGDADDTPGRSLYVRLSGPDNGPGAAGNWSEYVAPRVMLRPGDRALFRGRSTAPAQHNLSTLGRVA